MTESLFYVDPYLRSCEATVTASDGRGIRLDRTVFYPMGGGQPGDAGVMYAEDGREVRVGDTRKGEQPGEIWHVPADGITTLEIGDTVRAVIDWERRHRHMRMHTCLHLLCAVVPAGVTGGSINTGYGRLDFDLPDQLLDRDEITEKLNRLIQEAHPVLPRWITDEEIDARPELVKTMSVQPPRGLGRVRLLDIPGVDLQACGGTHVANTAEIGPVAVTKVEKKSTHNRRVVVSFVR
ncbi:MAG TPA: alanyl-tRNA editing protein [Burkholderiales bacterium]|nr:alanyl-tRNA editing protein [Burkholderiales bacterium]